MGKKTKIYIFLFFLIVFLISIGVLLKFSVVDPYIAKKDSDEIKAIYYEKYSDQDPKWKVGNISYINEDIKGWLKIDNTVIDYPVLQSEDSTFYLDHNYKKEYSRYGSIFIDSECKDGVDSKNIILHGHHMKDGQMFADLMKFEDLDFYKSSPIIKFDTEKYTSNWKIFSIFKTNTLEKHGDIFNYLAISFKDDRSFLNYIYNLRIRSIINTEVDIKSSDQIMILSTCSYELDDFRTVLAARRVRDGEDSYVDTQKAQKNPSPLMPSAWYKQFGGSMPDYSDFESAYNAGEIDWFNG